MKNWCTNVSDRLLLAVLWGFIFRIFMLYLFEDLSGEKVVYFNVIFLVAFVEHRVTAWTSSIQLKVLGCYVYVELMQVYLYILTIYADPAHTVFYCMASTVFCLNYQITLNTSSFMVVFYVFKQFFTWTMISASVGLYKYTTFFPYMPMIMMILLTISVNRYRQKLARDRNELLTSVSNQERRLQSVMQAIPDGVVVITSSNEIKTWNDELCRLLLSLPSEPSIKSSMQLLSYEPGSKKTVSPHTNLWVDILAFIESSQPPQTFGTTLVDGRFLEWKGSRGFWDQTKACILTVRDFTDWVNLKEKLQRESSAKTALLRSVSHELRTPTNAVINLVREVIEEEALTPRGAEDLKLVSICTHFLLSMINDLLDYSKLLAGQFTLTKTQFNLSDEIHQTFLLFDPQCRAKRLDYTLNIDPLLPALVYSDPNRMKQVLLNLLSNAVKYPLSQVHHARFHPHPRPLRHQEQGEN